MEDKLDINSILKANNNHPVKIGELNYKVIENLNLDCSPRNIILTADRIYHCEKHKSEYKDENSYNQSIVNIPKIISNPDYIGFNKSNIGYMVGRQPYISFQTISGVIATLSILT